MHTMLTQKDLNAIRIIFREEFAFLRMGFKEDLQALNLREELKGLKEETHAFHEDILDVMALIKLQHQLIHELDTRLKKIEKLLYPPSS
jgi:hypothetical protein